MEKQAKILMDPYVLSLDSKCSRKQLFLGKKKSQNKDAEMTEDTEFYKQLLLTNLKLQM